MDKFWTNNQNFIGPKFVKLKCKTLFKVSKKYFALSGEEQKKALESETKILKEKLAPTESAVVEASNKLKKLQVINKNK